MEVYDGEISQEFGTWDEAIPVCYDSFVNGFAIPVARATTTGAALPEASNSWLAMDPTAVPTGLFPELEYDCINCPAANQAWDEGDEAYFVDRSTSTFTGGAPAVKSVLNTTSLPTDISLDTLNDPMDRVGHRPPWKSMKQQRRETNARFDFNNSSLQRYDVWSQPF